MNPLAPPPQNPAGPFRAEPEFKEETNQSLITILKQSPVHLRKVVDGLDNSQLDTTYRNWSVRQIVHHLADSHVHSYIRFKWALTEDNPTIKAYEEGDWVLLDDAKSGDIEPALALMDGLHQKWVQLLSRMATDQFSRTFVHPQTGETVNLWTAVNYYAWHARHHTAQITWLRDRYRW